MLFFNLLHGFLKTDGRIIVDEVGNKVVMRGFGLGGWTVLEGYMWNYHGFGSTSILEQQIQNLVGEENKNLFFDLFRKNYISEGDIKLLSESGYNTLRIPLHYKHFSEEEGSYNTIGFEILDPIISLCKEYGIFVVLDMHAAPGGQNSSDFSDSDGQTAYLWENPSNRRWLASIWKYIADYYSDNRTIVAYDLLNEPVIFPYGPSILYNLYKDIKDSIRSVDENHILFLEGNWYGNDFNGLTPPIDNNMGYSFHHYVGASGANNDNQWIGQYTEDLSETFNVPLWIGEVGENSNHWAHHKADFFESHNIGWSWWNFKSIGRISSLLSVKNNKKFQNILDFWSGSKPMPSVEESMEGLLGLANSYHIDSCIINYDLISAHNDSSFTINSKPFKKFSPPGILQASNYDIGANGVGSYDLKYEDPNKFNSGSIAWNNGWTYRNDGVDISGSVDNGDLQVGWVEESEWMKYTIQPENPGSFNVYLRIGTAIDGSKITVFKNDTIYKEDIVIPNTGGWNQWRLIPIGVISFNNDDITLKIRNEVGSYNFKEIIFDPLDLNNTPVKFSLNGYPNPSNENITIKWENDYVLNTTLNIFNLNGEKLINKSITSLAGTNTFKWDFKDYNRKKMPSGIYFIKLSTKKSSEVFKATLLK